MGRRNQPGERERFIVGVGRYVVEMSGLESIKEKRSLVAKIKDRVANRWNVSIADVGPQNDSDEAIIGVAAVSSDREYLQSVLNSIPNFIDELGVGRVVSEDFDIQAY